ncbi:MAG: sulfur carrier protein ThiS [Planctomycetota bacterium]
MNAPLPPPAVGASQIVVNGAVCPLPAARSLAAVLADAGLADRPVAVEVDGEVVPRGRFTEPLLRGGERIEIVTFVGGG